MPDSGNGRQRVMFLRPTLGQGGADRVTLILLKYLDRNMFDIDLVLMKDAGDFLPDVPDDVSVHILGSNSLHSAWMPLIRLLKNVHPDILVSTSGGTNVIAALAHLLTSRRRRLVLSERNVLLRGRSKVKRRLLIIAKRWLYPLADEIACVSRGVRDDVALTLKLPMDRLTVVYNPVVTDELEALQKVPVNHPWFDGSVPVVVAAGRLVYEKGFDTLLRAFAIVRSRMPVHLVVLGEGPLAAELGMLAEDLGVSDQIWFAGFDKNPFRYMARSNVFVLSSRNEGFPGVLIQAMACGAAVVSTDCHSGPSEVITDGVDGFLVPVEDHHGLASQVEHLLRDPVLQAQIGGKARAAVAWLRVEPAIERYTNVLLGTSEHC